MTVSTEQEWQKLIHTAGLVVVDVFSEWCGPCQAMDAHLKKCRVASVQQDDRYRHTTGYISICTVYIHTCRVILARARSDNIEELAPFRSDPRPTWLFLSSGIPTALLRGANR